MCSNPEPGQVHQQSKFVGSVVPLKSLPEFVYSTLTMMVTHVSKRNMSA